jgi:hypothetical protein
MSSYDVYQVSVNVVSPIIKLERPLPKSRPLQHERFSGERHGQQ